MPFSKLRDRPEKDDATLPVRPTVFTKDTSVLIKGNYYLLKAPEYCDSGYAVALYKGWEDGGPAFEDESWGLDISLRVIEGWVAVKGLR